MYNDLFSIGPFTVHGYGLMIAIGIIVAYIVAEIRARKLGLNSDTVIDMVLFCAIIGFLGAKVLFLITQIPNIIQNPSMLKQFASGWVVYGGIIFGILGGMLCCYLKKEIFWKYFDLVIGPVALAQAFGRVGCFLAGCCYGKETTSAFHVVFHNSGFAPNDVPLLPTQLISAGLCLILFLILTVVQNKWTGDYYGTTGACYLIFYSIGRFCLEFLRGDIVRGNVGIFSTSQFIGFFTLAAGIFLLVLARKRKLPIRKMFREENV